MNDDTARGRKEGSQVEGPPHTVADPGNKLMISRTLVPDTSHELRYRLPLAPGARAGQFAWPVSLSVSPVI